MGKDLSHIPPPLEKGIKATEQQTFKKIGSEKIVIRDP
jgi:hypothetical protein